jgi:hypothetical protein
MPAFNYHSPHVFIDIETVPRAFEGPDEDALHITRSRIVCLCAAYNNEAPVGFAVDPTEDPDEGELQILNWFQGYLGAAGVLSAPVVLVGHNILSFDLPRLWLRARRERHVLGSWLPNPATPPWKESRVIDTKRMLGPTNPARQYDLARFFGVSLAADPGEGSNVRSWWRVGDTASILAHCLSDIAVNRAVFERLV